VRIVKLTLNDNRKVYPEVYAMKPDKVEILTIPPLQFVSQTMHGKLNSEESPFGDPRWIVWKVVNQLKRLTKGSLQYQFKLMPNEVVWHGQTGDDYSYTQMMQVPDRITFDFYEEARRSFAVNYKDSPAPLTDFVSINQGLCAQKLHYGPYRDTGKTLADIEQYVSELGYRIVGDRREIFLNPPMCNPIERWQTIVRVQLKKV
jgi:hypothetical protein